MPAALPAISTMDFLNRLGVNTHIEYTDGRYADIDQVSADLSFLGINQVRDFNLDPNNQGQGSYGDLASDGMRFNFLVNPSKTISQTISLARAFALAHPGAVESIEGPNEVNNWPVSYNGQTGAAGAKAYQAALYAAVKADSVLGSLPVFNFTDYPDQTGAADFANFHSYPKNGDQPWGQVSNDFSSQAGVMAGKPMVLTEVGYYSLPNASGWGGVDQASQAKMTLNTLFDAVSLGVQKIYLYQLLDAYADPTNSDQEKHFGLFDINNTPKTAANAIRNLTSLLAGGNSSAVTTLGYTLSGLPTTGSSLELQKSAGVYDIVVWNEPDIWNQTTHTAINAGSSAVTLNLSASAQMTVYDPMSGTAPIKTGSGASIQFSVSDHPVIVEVTTSAPTTSAPPTTVTFTTGGLGHFGDFAFAASAPISSQGEDATPAPAELEDQAASVASAPDNQSAAQEAASVAAPILSVAQAGYYWDRYSSDTLVASDGSAVEVDAADAPAPAAEAVAPAASALQPQGAMVTFVTTGPQPDQTEDEAPPAAPAVAQTAAVQAGASATAS